MYVLNGIVVYISSTLYCGLKVLVLYATVKYRIDAPYHKGITKVTRHSTRKAPSLYQTVYIVLIFYNITDYHIVGGSQRYYHLDTGGGGGVKIPLLYLSGNRAYNVSFLFPTNRGEQYFSMYSLWSIVCLHLVEL